MGYFADDIPGYPHQNTWAVNSRGTQRLVIPGQSAELPRCNRIPTMRSCISQ